MARFRIMTWNGIPAQVKADDDQGGRANREMPAWFAAEIDRIAMRDGLAGTDEYTAGFTWSRPEVREGSAADVVDAVIREQCAAWGRSVED
jgi:hypothetical protein